MHAEGVTVDITNERAEPRFFLIYQGLDDRELQCQLSRLYVPPREAEQPFKPSPPAKIRIGFISRFFTEHNIARLMGGLITDLSRDRFDVTAISVGAHSDARAKRIQQQADHFVQVPFKLPAARSLIAQQHLDVLFYTDIGMEPMTYSLAFSRLAPVQCATWGHGVTTGIPTIDYFISSIHLESVGSEQQYTEQLVRLKALAVPYYRIAPPKSFEDATILVCRSRQRSMPARKAFSRFIPTSTPFWPAFCARIHAALSSCFRARSPAGRNCCVSVSRQRCLTCTTAFNSCRTLTTNVF